MRGREAHADLVADLTQCKAPLLIERQRGQGRLREVAVAALDRGEADPVFAARIFAVEFGFTCLALRPNRMHPRFQQDFLVAHLRLIVGDLRPDHAEVAQSEFDGIDIERLGGLVDQHFDAHDRLQRTVSARRAGLDCARGNCRKAQIALGNVIDRKRLRRPGHAHIRRHIRPSAAVQGVCAFNDLEFARAFVGHQRVLHPEGMLLHSHLKLFVSVVRQADRPALAIEPGNDAEIGEDGMVLRAVSDGVADVEVDHVDAEIRFRQHLRSAGGTFVR